MAFTRNHAFSVSLSLDVCVCVCESSYIYLNGKWCVNNMQNGWNVRNEWIKLMIIVAIMHSYKMVSMLLLSHDYCLEWCSCLAVLLFCHDFNRHLVVGHSDYPCSARFIPIQPCTIFTLFFSLYLFGAFTWMFHVYNLQCNFYGLNSNLCVYLQPNNKCLPSFYGVAWSEKSSSP